MLRVLFVFMAITDIYCQTNCPDFVNFSGYPNQNGLQSKLNETFKVAYTSAGVVDCQKATYVIGANGITNGSIESPKCCLKVDDFVFDSNQLDYSIGPVSGYTDSCSFTTDQDGSMKLLATTGSGRNLCLIVAICQIDYYGISVMCRGTPPLLTSIVILLSNLLAPLGLTGELTALRSVSQTSCVFPNKNCPA